MAGGSEHWNPDTVGPRRRSRNWLMPRPAAPSSIFCRPDPTSQADLDPKDFARGYCRLRNRDIAAESGAPPGTNLS